MPNVEDYPLPSLVTATPALRAFRERAGISMREVARQAGISDSALSHIELGRRTRKQNLFAVLDVLEAQDGGDFNVSAFIVELLDKQPEAAASQSRENIIPTQNSIIRFGLSESGKLKLIPGLQDENDYDSITAFRDELLPSLRMLEERYSSNRNTEYAGFFAPLVNRYLDELKKDPRTINYAILYARGSRFYAAREYANQQIAIADWTAPDVSEAEAIDNICDLHGPLVMASEVGRRIVRDRQEYESTPEDERKEDELIQKFGESLSKSDDLFEHETATAIADLTSPVPNDRHPARSRGLRTLVVGSALVSTVGMVAWASAGWTGVVPVAVATMLGLETIKKTNGFKSATENLAKSYDNSVEMIDAFFQTQAANLLPRLESFVESKKELIEKVSSLRPEFQWAKKVLVQRDAAASGHPASFDPKETRHILIVSDDPETSTFARMLAARLNRPYVDVARQIETRLGMPIEEHLSKHGKMSLLSAIRVGFEGLREMQPTVHYLDRSTHHVFYEADISDWVINNAYVARFVGLPLEDERHSFRVDAKISFAADNYPRAATVYAKNFMKYGQFDRIDR